MVPKRIFLTKGVGKHKERLLTHVHILVAERGHQGVGDAAACVIRDR